MKSLRDSLLSGGRCPQTPGIYRLGARMAALGGGRSRPRPFRRLSRRSPYPRLRYFQSGSHQPRRAILLQRTATTPLTDCLTIGVHCTEGDPHPALAPCPTNPISGSFLDGKMLTIVLFIASQSAPFQNILGPKCSSMIRLCPRQKTLPRLSASPLSRSLSGCRFQEPPSSIGCARAGSQAPSSATVLGASLRLRSRRSLNVKQLARAIERDGKTRCRQRREENCRANPASKQALREAAERSEK